MKNVCGDRTTSIKTSLYKASVSPSSFPFEFPGLGLWPYFRPNRLDPLRYLTIFIKAASWIDKELDTNWLHFLTEKEIARRVIQANHNNELTSDLYSLIYSFEAWYACRWYTILVNSIPESIGILADLHFSSSRSSSILCVNADKLIWRVRFGQSLITSMPKYLEIGLMSLIWNLLPSCFFRLLISAR